MKVLVFPVLLAIAIYVSPPKPFTAVQAGKEVTARTVTPSEALNSVKTSANNLPATLPAAQKQALPVPSDKEYTARR